MVPSFAHFPPALKLGMKQGLQGQTRGPRQDDFEDNSIGIKTLLDTPQLVWVETNYKWVTVLVCTKRVQDLDWMHQTKQHKIHTIPQFHLITSPTLWHSGGVKLPQKSFSLLCRDYRLYWIGLKMGQVYTLQHESEFSPRIDLWVKFKYTTNLSKLTQLKFHHFFPTKKQKLRLSKCNHQQH
jgi:hypothetical protein